MLTVYTIPPSLYCAKLRILLRHKGLDWEEIPPPGGYGSDEYKTVVPSGNLPALVDGGLLLADSEAIAEYLDETYPDPPMLPADIAARARVRERSRFHDTRLEPELRKLFPHFAQSQRDATVAERQSGALSARLEQFGRMLADAPPGDSLTLGDCGFPITFAWIDVLTPIMDLSIAWPAAVGDYRRHVARHAAVADELAAYGATLRESLARWTAE